MLKNICRDAGHIAIAAGIAGGADVILIPEIPYTIDHICHKIKERQEQGTGNGEQGTEKCPNNYGDCYKAVNPEDTLVKTARGLGIYLGD